MCIRRRIRRSSRRSNQNICTKDQIVEKDLQDKISLWISRIIFKLKTEKKFLDHDNYFDNEQVASYLGLEEYTIMDKDDFKRSEVLRELKEKYTKIGKQKNKAWINRILKTNTIPTIWITNNIQRIDNAIVRRFDMNIQMPIPTKSKRANIIKKYSNNILYIN